MGNSPSEPKLPEAEERSVLNYDVSSKAIAEKIRTLAETRTAGVVVMAGAGISVSAGIPDFRSPGTGLYDNLAKYDLPRPEAIFSIDYFKEKPEAFCTLAREMWPGTFAPTPTHFFLLLLERKGVLKRVFTQNIDTLEREAGVSPERLVEAHGSFAGAHCIECHVAHDCDGWLKAEILAGRVPRCTQEGGCGVGLVKPDIVFFGEGLPPSFARCRASDLPEAEVLLVLGTSLQVAPFCELLSECPPTCPRLLLNLNAVGERKSGRAGGFRFNEADNYRDAALLMGCDEGVRLLCGHLGWRQELDGLEQAYKEKRKQHLEQAPAAMATATARDDAQNSSSSSSSVDGDGDGVDGSGGGEEEEGEGEGTLQAALCHNWRRLPPVLPPLLPFDAVPLQEEGKGLASGLRGLTCTLVEPASLAEVVGGSPAWFRVGLHGGSGDSSSSSSSNDKDGGGDKLSFAGRAKLVEDRDYLALYPGGSTLPSEKTDRDFPFATRDTVPASAALAADQRAYNNGGGGGGEAATPNIVELLDGDDEGGGGGGGGGGSGVVGIAEKEVALPARLQGLPYPPPFAAGRPLRLRVPWVRYELPFDMEVWYVDGATDEVLARWGPLTIAANGPDDPNEETHEASDMPDLDENEMADLVSALSNKFNMPPEFIKGMIQQKMMGGGQEEEEEEEDGNDQEEAEISNGDGGAAAVQGEKKNSGLAAGFAALKKAAGKGEEKSPAPVISPSSAPGEDEATQSAEISATRAASTTKAPEPEYECD